MWVKINLIIMVYREKELVSGTMMLLHKSALNLIF